LEGMNGLQRDVLGLVVEDNDAKVGFHPGGFVITREIYGKRILGLRAGHAAGDGVCSV